MTVYIVYQWEVCENPDCSGCCGSPAVCGIYSTKEKAEAAAKELFKAFVEETKLDERIY